MGFPTPKYDRIAIRRCPGDVADADAAGRTGPIIDDDRLSERCAHLLGQYPGGSIARSASRKGNDDRDWTRRIGLRKRTITGRQESAQNNAENT